MASFDLELLAILRCPESGGDLELVDLPPAVARSVVEKYREHFRDETPTAEQGLLCRQSDLLYPIVSDIPLLLKDEALPASVLDAGAEPTA
jgi:uncharacterized protein YbaR (Trm112 family)